MKKRSLAVLGLNLALLSAAFSADEQRSAPVIGQAWSASLPADAKLDLAWIPPGSFTMGSPATEPGRHADESPQTEVTLTRGFWLGKTFVTIGQWKAVMGLDVLSQLKKAINDDTKYELEGKRETLCELMHWSRSADPSTYLANEEDDLPMYFASWSDAMIFAQALTTRFKKELPSGYGFTLPTEAQWEYACRAGTTGPTYAGPNSPEILDQIAWYAQNSAVGYQGRPVAPTPFGPRKVGVKKPNAWGLYDMQGNLWQWCLDWYGPYPGGHVTDPHGPSSGTGRVNRGGSFGSGANSERSAGRASNPQPEASAYRGFRIALSPLGASHE